MTTLRAGRLRSAALLIPVLASVVAVPAGQDQHVAAAVVEETYRPGPCISNVVTGGHPFTDVPPGAFYAEAVAWLYSNEITVGVAPTLYGSDEPVTRAQFATMLHRVACLPAADSVAPFVDLRPGAFYRAAVDWMFGAGITTGKTATTFGPDDHMTRGEFAAFLHRFVGEPEGVPIAGAFGDVDRARFFARPIDWLVWRSVTQGTSATTFSPDRTITRAEVATFLHRLNTIADVALVATTVSTAFSSPTAVATHPTRGDFYVAEQDGKVRRVAAGAGGVPDFGSITTVLDVNDLVLSAGEPGGRNEQGLLGVAVAPDGASLFVAYTDALGDLVVAEYTITGDGSVDAGSDRVVIVIDQPSSNHNGGHLVFGPDGYLYIGSGDGGGTGDPLGNGQDTTTLLGAVLRIDPFTPALPVQYSSPAGNPFRGVAGADEIWLYGLRNPWKFAFDAPSGDLWIADVGQSSREEISRFAAGEARRNLGWNLREGTLAFAGPEPVDHLPPVHDYDRSDGCSITGGLVYRGSDIPALDGTYLHTDFCTPELRGWRDLAGPEAVDFDVTIPSAPTTFAQDLDGEIYVFGRGGAVARIARALG